MYASININIINTSINRNIYLKKKKKKKKKNYLKYVFNFNNFIFTNKI